MSTLTFNANQYGSHNLTDLINTVGQTNAKFSDKSLRLHTSGNGNEKTIELKVHTSRSNVLTNLKAVVGGSNFQAVDKRETSRAYALDMVRHAVKNEFGLTEDEALILVKHICKNDDRVQLGELQKLKNAGTEIKKALDQNLNSFFNSMCEGKTNVRHPGMALEKLLNDYPSLGDKCKEFVLNHKFIESLKNEAIKGDKSSLNKLEELSKALGNAEGDCPKLKKFIGESLNTVRISLQEKLIPLDYFVNGTEVKQQWEQKFSKEPLQKTELRKLQEERQKFGEVKLGELLKSDSWKVSSTGTNRAMIISDNDLPGKGVILKFEFDLPTNASKQISDYMSSVCNSFNESGIDLPFDGMVSKTLTIGPNDISSFKDKINSFDDPFSKKKNLNGLNKATNEELKPIEKMYLTAAMKVDNASPLDQLNPVDKLVLCKGDQFPKQLGQAMILGRMFGLGDHIGISSPGNSENKFQGGQTNASNFMIKNDTGKLVFIDYGYCPNGRGTRELPVNGFPEKTLTPAFRELRDFIKNHFSGENIQKSMQMISDYMKDVKPQNRLDSGEALGPLASVMDLVHSCADDSALFKTDERAALNLLSPQDKAKFSANVLLGVLDGLKLVAENKNKFRGEENLELPFDGPDEVLDTIVELNKDLKGISEQIQEFLQNSWSK